MRAGLALVLVGLAVALSSCAGGPAYAPQESDGAIGYSDQQLAQGRYRVTFAGDIDDTREQVEAYLLRRAAEVTLAAGYTHFVVDKLNTETKVSHHTVYETVDRPLTWRGQPTSRTALSAALRPNWQSSLLLPRDLGDMRRYVATSEIVLLTGEALARNPNAISARDVLDRTSQAGPG